MESSKASKLTSLLLLIPLVFCLIFVLANFFNVLGINYDDVINLRFVEFTFPKQVQVGETFIDLYRGNPLALIGESFFFVGIVLGVILYNIKKISKKLNLIFGISCGLLSLLGAIFLVVSKNILINNDGFKLLFSDYLIFYPSYYICVICAFIASISLICLPIIAKFINKD